jgi:nicotinamide-nucleotide amidase
MVAIFPAGLMHEARALLAALEQSRLKLATAESCTGGLLAGLLTEIPGASAVLERGLVTYSNEAKTELLGIDSGLIRREGAVSDAVARAMAEGALGRCPVDLTVAITGVAGPGGGTPDKPVGLVHIAVARKGKATLHQECRFGDIGRAQVRLESLREALALLRRALV